jgi:hypothetical protein
LELYRPPVVPQGLAVKAEVQGATALLHHLLFRRHNA